MNHKSLTIFDYHKIKSIYFIKFSKKHFIWAKNNKKNLMTFILFSDLSVIISSINFYLSRNVSNHYFSISCAQLLLNNLLKFNYSSTKISLLDLLSLLYPKRSLSSPPCVSKMEIWFCNSTFLQFFPFLITNTNKFRNLCFTSWSTSIFNRSKNQS